MSPESLWMKVAVSLSREEVQILTFGSLLESMESVKSQGCVSGMGNSVLIALQQFICLSLLDHKYNYLIHD